MLFQKSQDLLSVGISKLVAVQAYKADPCAGRVIGQHSYNRNILVHCFLNQFLFFCASVRFQNDPIHLGGDSDPQIIRFCISGLSLGRDQLYICIRIPGCLAALVDGIPHQGILLSGNHQIMFFIACCPFPFSQVYLIQSFLEINPDSGQKQHASCQNKKDSQCGFFHNFTVSFSKIL